MKKQIVMHCECGHSKSWWHDCVVPPPLLDEVKPEEEKK